MTDIEVKRKELETAKRMLQNGNCMTVDCDECPFGCSLNSPYQNLDAKSTVVINSFISTREAELAAMENTADRSRVQFQGCNHCGIPTGAASDGLSHVQTATGTMEILDRVCATPRTGAIPAGDPSFRFTDRVPTIDDFALALIQGGYFETRSSFKGVALGEDEAISSLINRASKIKEALDRRRV